MTPDQALTVGLLALGWVVGNDDVRPVFLGSTGLSEDDLRDRADEPDLLASVLEFVALDDAWILGFAAACGLDPAEPFAALTVLNGASRTHWT